MIWGWINDPLVRKNSFNTATIPYEEHTAWFNNTLKNKNHLYYIMCLGKTPIGQARFLIDIAKAEISVLIAEAFRGKGFGIKTISMSSNTVLSERPTINEIIALVKIDNIISQHAFIRSGYKQNGTVLQKGSMANVYSFKREKKV